MALLELTFGVEVFSVYQSFSHSTPLLWMDQFTLCDIQTYKRTLPIITLDRKDFVIENCNSKILLCFRYFPKVKQKRK